ELILDGKPCPVKLGEEANLGARIDAPGNVEAEAVFVGHALRIPEAQIDDLQGVDLKGKIAVFLDGAPSTLPAPLAAHSQSAAERWKNLKAAGAIGTMSFADPKTTDIPWSRSTLARLNPVLTLTEPALNDTVGSRLAIQINPQYLDVFLTGTDQT